MEEKKKGRLLTFGLKTGPTIMALTEEPVKEDPEFLIVKTTEGETVTVRISEIVYTRSKEVDIPTDEEVEEFFKNLLSKTPLPVKDLPKDVLGGAYI